LDNAVQKNIFFFVFFSSKKRQKKKIILSRFKYFSFHTMRRGFRTTKGVKAPMMSKEGENDAVIQQRLQEDPVFYEERTTEYFDFFGPKGFLDPEKYEQTKKLGFLHSPTGHGFGGTQQWPFDFGLAIKNARYREAIARTFTNIRYAPNWKVEAEMWMASVVKRLQKEHDHEVSVLTSNAMYHPTLPQSDYDDIEFAAVRKYEVMGELDKIFKLAMSDGWLETVRFIGYTKFVEKYMMDPTYTQFTDVSDAVNTIKKAFETAILDDVGL